MPTTTNRQEVIRPGQTSGLKVAKAGDLTYWANAMIYGEANTGKTHLLGSASVVECFSPILIISMDKGEKTLKGCWPDVDVLLPANFMDVQRILNELFKTGGKYEGVQYKSLGFDNATTAQKRGIEYLYDQEEPSIDFVDFEAATWANGGWNRSSEQMRRMFDYYGKLPMHKFFTSWARDFGKPTKTNPNPAPKWAPSFSSSLAMEVPGYFDSVLFMKFETVADEKTKKQADIRVIQSEGTTTVMAKDRDGGKRLPKIIREPTMLKLAQGWGLI